MAQQNWETDGAATVNLNDGTGYSNLNPSSGTVGPGDNFEIQDTEELTFTGDFADPSAVITSIGNITVENTGSAVGSVSFNLTNTDLINFLTVNNIIQGTDDTIDVTIINGHVNIGTIDANNVTNGGILTVGGGMMNSLDNTSGTLDVIGNTAITAAFTNGGIVNIADGQRLTLTVGSTIATLGGAGDLVSTNTAITVTDTATGGFNGSIDTGSGALTLTEGVFNGSLNAEGAVTITGSGITGVSLNAANIFNGTVTISAGGTVNLGHDDALDGTGTVTLSNNAWACQTP
ncbi:MAG: hypothetical protein FWH27_17890 [Planctomycetaceae bacterium]|nr:hypothetical protein [Planctomycetaceae bacterium]